MAIAISRALLRLARVVIILERDFHDSAISGGLVSDGTNSQKIMSLNTVVLDMTLCGMKRAPHGVE